MSETKDVVVAGGGVAGLAFALALRRGARASRIAVADPSLGGSGVAPHTLRAVAVAAGSRRFLEGLGVWDAVAAEAQPMIDMVITDSRNEDAPRPVFLEFDGEVEPHEPFAHMVFQDRLRGALTEAARAADVEIMNAKVDGFRRTGSTLTIMSDRASFRSRLLVAADGGRSRLREAAGISTVGWDYGQAGLVATLSHTLPHDGRATQHFLPEGPLAMLPLRSEDGSERRSSLVWTLQPEEARRLVSLSTPAFLAALESRIGLGYGTLSLDDEPRAYPLRLLLPRRLVAHRFALLGDAARTIHPLAGQGLNLGLRDAAALSESVTVALGLGLDPASPDLLKAYEQARRFDAVLMAGATDGLNRLFSNDLLPVRMLRDFGLGLVDRLPALKHLFVRDAAGLAGAVPERFRR